MTEREIQGLCCCFKCGSMNVKLLSNARRQFQIRCEECGARTRWTRKNEAIISWFNSYISTIK